MLEGMVGRIGGYKSYNAVLRVLAGFLQSRTMGGNLAIKFDPIAKLCRDKYRTKISPKQWIALTDQQLQEGFWRHVPRDCDIYLDEAHLYLSFMDGARELREVITFFTQSRKYQINGVFITQIWESVQAKIRGLCQYVWRYRDMEKWKIPVLNIPWPLPQYREFQYDYDGKTMLDSKLRWKKRYVYDLYDTNATYCTPFHVLEQFERGAAEKIIVPPWYRRHPLRAALVAEGVAATPLALRLMGVI